MTSVKILVVEDEGIIAKDIQNRLKKLGYVVDNVVSSGEKAVEKAAETHPDLVLMDINLAGDMDGVEAARQIFNRFNIPVIYLTAYTNKEILERAKETGASGYLVKPFKENELYTNIEMTLAKHRTEISKIKAKDEELQEKTSRFIVTASHEFRTPLTVISTSAELLKNYEHKLNPEKRRKNLESIEVSINNLKKMLDTLLVMNQSDIAELEFHPAPLDLLQFCRTFVEELQSSLDSEHQIVLKIHDEKFLNKTNNIDQELLLQILTHLLSNAIKFSPGSKTVNFELDFQDGAAIFQIRDEGIGIPPEDQEKVFEPFYRAKNVSNIPGLGLGLSVVKKSVDLHGGQITFASHLETGTTFTVKIPLISFTEEV